MNAPDAPQRRPDRFAAADAPAPEGPEMPLKTITLNGQQILVEVADLKADGPLPAASTDGFENTSLAEDMKDRLDPILKAFAAPVQAVMQAAGAAEWSIEINVGFEGEAGIPFVVGGKANAAVKVSATWKKG
jgi:hypothetical protein